ncbi:MAG: hypothetical protein QOJ86_1887 [Bradyrhizobium sp.]|jgi:hypothetical protein|nr:hypothetical protein [Bradyrhizobium sp.]
MNKLLASTSVCLVLGTAAFAQSPNNSTTSPSSSQPQNNSRDRDSSTQRTPDSAAQNQPSGSTQNQSSQNQSSQNQSSQNQSSQNQSSGSAQNQPSGSAKDQPSSSAQNQPSGSTANQPAPNSTASQPAPAPSSNPSQAQSNPPSQSGSPPAPSQAQTNNPPAANNQAQQNSGNANTNQPAPSNQGNTAQSHQTNVNASVNLNDQQRTRVSQSFARLNVQPVRNVNFSVSVGTVVPRDVHLQTVPADVVEIVPQYRGYSFFAVRDEIVIVDPATYKIVTVLPRSGGGTAAAPASSHSRVSFTDKDREVVRKHVRSSTERRTTGSSATRVEIRRGERVPDTVEIEEFPETVYREAPALREYRYIHRDNRTYVVEPTERRIIEEID